MCRERSTLLDPIEQLCWRRNQTRTYAQSATQLLHSGAMFFNSQATMQTKCFGGYFTGDIRVGITISPHPPRQLQPFERSLQGRVVELPGFLEIVLYGGGGVS